MIHSDAFNNYFTGLFSVTRDLSNSTLWNTTISIALWCRIGYMGQYYDMYGITMVGDNYFACSFLNILSVHK